jgi:hypothetical protein
MDDKPVEVVGCSGHRILSDEVFDDVRACLVDTLARLHPSVGVCSLASGADQVFAELILERGISLHVIVPSRDFHETLDVGDRERYACLRARASRVEVLDHEFATNRAFVEAGERIVELCDVLLAVWDGEPARGPGGTADVVAHARAQGRPLIVIWPADTQR